MKVFNDLFNYKLTPNAMKIYVYLTHCKNDFHRAIVKIKTISQNCAIQSSTSIHKALGELEAKGLIEKYRRKNTEGNYIANGYQVKQLSGKWFTLRLERNPFILPKSCFAVYLCILKCSNSLLRAWPSYSQLAKVLVLSRSTIAGAIKELTEKLFLRKAAKWAGKHNLYILKNIIETETPEKIKESNPAHGVGYSTIGENSWETAFSNTIINTFTCFVKKIKDKASFLLSRVVRKMDSSNSTHLIAIKKEE